MIEKFNFKQFLDRTVFLVPSGNYVNRKLPGPAENQVIEATITSVTRVKIKVRFNNSESESEFRLAHNGKPAIHKPAANGGYAIYSSMEEVLNKKNAEKARMYLINHIHSLTDEQYVAIGKILELNDA